jgi:putative tricarboxylic transport membrane protein
MEMFVTSLTQGVIILTSPEVLLFLAIGVVWGSICGALPGVGSGVAIGVMVPLTFTMEPVTAVAFLVSISVSNSFGNGLPAAVLGIPGSASGVLTAIEGYALTKRGLGGLAVGTNWFACVFGQFFSIPFFLFVIVPLAGITYVFLSPELFALYSLGLAALVSLTGRNILKGIAAALFGLAIGIVGPDPVSGVTRLAYGVRELRGGIPLIPTILGIVTISELLRSMRQVFDWQTLVPASASTNKFPGFRALRRSLRSVLTGSLIGTLIGSIPGMSGTAAAVMSYNQARLTSKTPEEFGNGSIEGLAANEAAGNASQAGEMVPTLGLGIPGSDSMVLVMGALMLQGFVPGPMMMNTAPQLLYATVAGLLGGALILFLFGWQLGKAMLMITKVDRSVILPLAFVVTLIGVFAVRQALSDVVFTLIFGVIGYYMLRFGFSVVATAVAAVLGAGFESNLRQGILLMDSDPFKFFGRPWTSAILTVSLFLLIYGTYGTIKMLRQDRVRSEEAAARRTAAAAARQT